MHDTLHRNGHRQGEARGSGADGHHSRTLWRSNAGVRKALRRGDRGCRHDPVAERDLLRKRGGRIPARSPLRSAIHRQLLRGMRPRSRSQTARSSSARGEQGSRSTSARLESGSTRAIRPAWPRPSCVFWTIRESGGASSRSAASALDASLAGMPSRRRRWRATDSRSRGGPRSIVDQGRAAPLTRRHGVAVDPHPGARDHGQLVTSSSRLSSHLPRIAPFSCKRHGCVVLR